jgi:riboflavin transporter FmnP
MNTKNNKNIRMITVTAIMSALSAVLMFVEISIPIMPSFIKLDISDLPALITSYAFGPVCGVAVCLVKNLIHLFSTSTFGVGELSNFLLGAIFVFVAGMFYKRHHNRKYALIGAFAGAFVMALLCFFINYYFVYPIYIKLMLPESVILGMYQDILPAVDSLWKAILIFNVPFTFVKGLISVVITFIVYPKLSPILKGKK